MSKDKIKNLYDQLLESGGLPVYMTGDWDLDKKGFTRQFDLDEEFLNSGLEIDDEFDEGFYSEY